MARLRARQLGQTVVSSSRRLSRVDKGPSSACRASAETTGCVRDASYGCETKLPLARLPAPSPRGARAASRPEADWRTRAQTAGWYPPERSGVAEGDVNQGCEQVGAGLETQLLLAKRFNKLESYLGQGLLRIHVSA